MANLLYYLRKEKRQSSPVNFFITLENGYLMAEGTKKPKMRLFPESETKFFGRVPDVQIEFISTAKNKISKLVLYQDGEESIGVPA